MCVYNTSEQLLLTEKKNAVAQCFLKHRTWGDAYSPVALRHHQSYSNHLQVLMQNPHLSLLTLKSLN